MADIENNKQQKKPGVKRIAKRLIRVELTPMVDLGFLLITFFVFTTTMAEAKVTQINLPYDKAPVNDDVCESCVMTVLLDKDNSVVYYEGALTIESKILRTNYAADGIRKAIVQKKASVKQVLGNADRFVLIIKPTTGSTFQNFVDIVDEAAICNVKRHYIAEVDEADKAILLNSHKLH